jgi:hypothetical protein
LRVAIDQQHPLTSVSETGGDAEAEGHARVPQSHRTADGYRLGQWVGVQRRKKDSMSAERRQRLDEVKFAWD